MVSRNAVWLVVGLLAAGLVLPMLAGVAVGGWGYGWGMVGPGMMGGWQGGSGLGWTWAVAMLLGTLGMLAFWAAVIVGVVLLVRWALGTAGPPRAEGSALEILKRRYAHGDIDQATYERMRRELES